MTGAALLFGLAAGALMALRITLNGEIWLDRTFWLTGLAAFGGLCAAPLTLPIIARTRLTPAYRAILGALLFAALFLLAMGGGVVVEQLFIAGEFEPYPGRYFRSLFFASTLGFVLFLASSPTYLMPWVLPLLMLGAGAILPRMARNNG